MEYRYCIHYENWFQIFWKSKLTILYKAKVLFIQKSILRTVIHYSYTLVNHSPILSCKYSKVSTHLRLSMRIVLVNYSLVITEIYRNIYYLNIITYTFTQFRNFSTRVYCTGKILQLSFYFITFQYIYNLLLRNIQS